MIRFFLIFLLYLLTNINIKAQVLLDLINNNIHGRVKEETIFTYAAYEKKNTLKKGILLWKAVSKYNEFGNKTEYFAYFQGDEESMDQHSKFKYNTQNRLEEEEIWFENSFIICKDSFKYDSVGRIIEILESENDGKFREKTTFTYIDSSIVYEYKYDKNNILKLKTFLRFDYRKKPIEIGVFNNQNDSLSSRVVSYYDSKSNLIKEEHFNNNGKLYDIGILNDL